MDNEKILSSVAAVKVLESWGVKDVYGYPGGSINSLMNALDIEKSKINFIQVRHEQVAALTASTHAKITGKIGVVFGSAGPGAVNLLNGLYDAKIDHAPVLAIVGQVTSNNINYDYFQEMPEVPIFSDVACYDRIVMNPESLPHVIDEAIKSAYNNHGVAVVVVPNDYGFKKIPNINYSTFNKSINKLLPQPSATDNEVKNFLKIVNQAKRPVIHVGRGIKNNGKKLVQLSKKLQIPIIMDGLSIGLIPNNYEGLLGTANRAASKAANEIIGTADLVIAIGGDFSFANTFYASHEFKYIQIDNHRNQLGRHHSLDLGIWSDAGIFIKKALNLSNQVPESPFFKSAVADMKNWNEYLNYMTESKNNRLLPPQVYKQINNHSNKDAMYSIDVGDNIINMFRYLNIDHNKDWSISALFATMGIGLPGAIAEKRAYPNRQVWNISGDGAQAMVMQDLVTLTKYQIPVINVVTSNNVLSFIKGEQEDINMNVYGIDLHNINYEMVAKGMGVNAVTVSNFDELKPAFDKAIQVTNSGKPFLINVKIADQRALPVEDIQINVENGKLVENVNSKYKLGSKKTYSIRDLFDEYNGQNLKPLTEFFKKFNVKI